MSSPSYPSLPFIIYDYIPTYLFSAFRYISISIFVSISFDFPLPPYGSGSLHLFHSFKFRFDSDQVVCASVCACVQVCIKNIYTLACTHLCTCIYVLSSLLLFNYLNSFSGKKTYFLQKYEAPSLKCKWQKQYYILLQ